MARPDGLSAEETEAVGRLTGSTAVDAEVVWERPHVVRITLADGRSVITKRPRRDPETGEPNEASRAAFHRERSVLALLAGVPGSPAPTLLGSEGELLVMEDLPPGRSLAELLLGSDADEARSAVVAYAEALARFHVATAGIEDRFDAGETQPWWADVTDAGVDGFAALAARFGVGAAAGDVAAEGHAVADDLRADGWWRTLVHGDACPDNTRIEDGPGGRFRLFDFERSSFGSCLLDASYLVAPFPTCWCFGRVPDDLSAEAVGAYRRVLGAVRPEALDDGAWGEALATALASWVVGRGDVITRLLDEDGTWGTSSVRVRVRQWLRAYLAAEGGVVRYPAVHAVASVLSDRLAEAWPEAALPDYPSLATGASAVVEVPDFWRPGL